MKCGHLSEKADPSPPRLGKLTKLKSVQKPGESAQKLPYLLDLTPEGVRWYAEDGKDKAPHADREALN